MIVLLTLKHKHQAPDQVADRVEAVETIFQFDHPFARNVEYSGNDLVLQYMFFLIQWLYNR